VGVVSRQRGNGQPWGEEKGVVAEEEEGNEEERNKDVRAALGSPELLEAGLKTEVRSTEDGVSVAAVEGR
jgi:hypothetical protein